MERRWSQAKLEKKAKAGNGPDEMRAACRREDFGAVVRGKYGKACREASGTVVIAPVVIEGKLPRRALGMVLEWASEHRAELMEDWNLCRAKQLPKPIKPLE